MDGTVWRSTPRPLPAVERTYFDRAMNFPVSVLTRTQSPGDMYSGT